MNSILLAKWWPVAIVALQSSCCTEAKQARIAPQLTAVMYLDGDKDSSQITVWIETTAPLWVHWNTVGLDTVSVSKVKKHVSPEVSDSGCPLFMYVASGEAASNSFRIPWDYGNDSPESATLTFCDDKHNCYEVPVRQARRDPLSPATIIVPKGPEKDR